MVAITARSLKVFSFQVRRDVEISEPKADKVVAPSALASESLIRLVEHADVFYATTSRHKGVNCYKHQSEMDNHGDGPIKTAETNGKRA